MFAHTEVARRHVVIVKWPPPRVKDEETNGSETDPTTPHRRERSPITRPLAVDTSSAMINTTSYHCMRSQKQQINTTLNMPGFDFAGIEDTQFKIKSRN